MKKIFFFLFVVHCILCQAQSPPLWSTLVPGNNGSMSACRNGNLFVVATAVQSSCSASYTYYAVLDNAGNLIWHNAFDSLNNCNFEISQNCTSIEGNNLAFAFSTHGITNDTDYVVVSDVNGNAIPLAFPPPFTPSFIATVGNMNDDHVYYSLYRSPLLSKLDVFGNLLWQYTGTDSTNVITTLYDPTRGLAVLGCENWENNTDGTLRILGIDTAGSVEFESDINLFIGYVETPKNVWLSSNYHLYGFAVSSQLNHQAFGADTSGNILWQTNLADYRDGAWDSIHQTLHCLVNAGNQVKNCYKIDALSGAIVDSIVIDSVASNLQPQIKVDRSGNIYIGYAQAFCASPTYRIDRYRPDYSFDWSGTFVDTTSGAGISMNFVVSDSGYVFLQSKNSLGTYFSKFAPPIVNGINNAFDSQNEFLLFPNPTASICNYVLSPAAQIQSCRYEVVDLQGKIILSHFCSDSGRGEIDLNALPSSVYFVFIVDQNGAMMGLPCKLIKL